MIELLITLVVIAIIVALTMPSFETILMNNQISMLVDELFDSLNYARLTAISKNTTVVVCPLGTSGSTTCGTNWALGWMVVTQPTTGTSVILQTYQTKTSGSNIPQLSANGATSVVLNARGLTTAAVDFKICDSRGASFARSLMILPTGFIQSGPIMGQAVWNGGALVCP